MTLDEALHTPNVQAFLRVIRAGETTQDDRAYRMMFGGALAAGLDAHPNKIVTANGYTSTAAGAYQFLTRTWNECVQALNLKDFSPASQDLAAVFLIRRRGALDDVVAGRLDEAVAKCNREWASLPGSPYGQPTRTMQQALAVYRQYGGVLAGEVVTLNPAPAPIPDEEAPVYAPPRPDIDPPPPPEPKKMAFPLALIAGLLPMVADLIPSITKIFKPGSPVAERNVAAASAVLDTVVNATKAINAQDAVEKMKADPALLAEATRAVDAWVDMVESGGGGIEGARKNDAAVRASGDMLHSPSFWITLFLLPLVYMVVGSVVGLWGGEWPSDVRAAIATAVVSLIVGGAAGYYWGQTTGRNRTSAT